MRWGLGASAAAAALGLALAWPTAASAWCQMTTEVSQPVMGEPCPTEGVPLQWERACISYTVDGEGSLDLPLDTVRDLADGAFGTWTGVTCPDDPTDFVVRQLADTATCKDSEFRRNDGNVNVIAFVRDWEERDLPTPSLVFALTTVWHDTSTGEILDVDIQVNEQQGPYTICPADGCRRSDTGVDLPNVLAHEVGHFFGVAHTNLDVSDVSDPALLPTMLPTANAGDTFMRTLAPDDEEALCSIYPPGTLTGACTTPEEFIPVGGLDLDCEDDGGGGRCSVVGGAGRPIGDAPRGWGVALALLAGFTLRRRARRAPR